MKVGFLQFYPFFKEREKNMVKIEEMIREFGDNIDLLVLPEMCTTGYSFKTKKEIMEVCESFDNCKEIPFFERLSKQFQVTIIAGIPEIEKEKIYNTAIIVTPTQGFLGKYRKIHLFMWEKFIFTPGDLPLQVWEINGVKVGIMICFDWYFPEVMRTLMLKGAQIVAHPSNLVLPYCQRVMPCRSLENRVFAITANRIGIEYNIEGKETKFTGRSIITDPGGNIIVEADVDEETIKVAEIDPIEATNKKITPFNNIITDRREEFYFK